MFDVSAPTTAVPGRFVEVALPTPVDRTFDYLVPAPLAARAQVGHRVKVSFGKRAMIGVIVAQKDSSNLLRSQIKEILEAPDDEPIVAQGVLRLTKWMAEYYACSWGEALQAALPAVVRTGRKRRMITVVKLAKSADEALARAVELEADASKEGRNKRYGKILRVLATFDDVFTPNALAERLGFSQAPLNTLRKQGWLRYEKIAPELGGFFVGNRGGDKTPENLTGEQASALTQIAGALDQTQFKAFLLFGITGSGKTEVYIRAIAHALTLGKSAIVLVPEIALTPQTLRRFSQRFADVTVLHSGMTDAQRREAWSRIRLGQSRVVIGPRSALFAPVKDLGLVVVDEEHEGTYKQDNTPRYHARDTAIVRCRLEGAVALMGSATPSLESWHNAHTGKYALLELRERPAATSGGLPGVELVDMAQESHAQHRLAFFSARMRGAINAALERKEQAIILLNRRGYHTLMICERCKQAVSCPNCDVPMNFHRRLEKAVCHYCLETRPQPKTCAFCGQGPIKPQGMGTEKLEEELKVLLAGHSVARMDSDVMKTREDYEATLEAFRAGETEVLVGTQMIAKGLDFPNVTVVGVISADTGMNLGDFRAYERTFQLVTQVAGRAGRGEKPGTVIVQTFKPTHPALQAAVKQDFRGFAAYEMEHRRLTRYPPFSKLVLVSIEGRDAAQARALAEKAAAAARDYAQQHDGAIFEVGGPFEAPMAKLRGRWREQLLIKARGFREVRGVVDAMRPLVKVGERLRMSIDVDPVDML
ncbi:MAG: primosomal protein N' [Planctomycetes bacterium]|nr:primosomal protein N' [Planctomycetota bacterium]